MLGYWEVEGYLCTFAFFFIFRSYFLGRFFVGVFTSRFKREIILERNRGFLSLSYV